MINRLFLSQQLTVATRKKEFCFFSKKYTKKVIATRTVRKWWHYLSNFEISLAVFSDFYLDN